MIAAEEFYKALIGWDTALWEGGEQPYTMWMNGERSVGGVMALPEDAREAGAPPHWLAYIAAPDTDATARRAAELGAEILVPSTEIPEVGKFSVIRDPHGAVFAIHTSVEETQGREGPPRPGDFSWHELATDDYEAAFGFYTDLFGWEKMEAMDMGGGWMYQMYGQGGEVYGVIFNKPPEMPVSNWLLYIRVEECHRAVEKVKELGGQVMNGPMEVPGGDYVAQCMDPQGAMFALHSTGHGGENGGEGGE